MRIVVEGKLCHEGRKLLREQFQIINTEEPTPIVIYEADVHLSNPEILTVQEDEYGDEDDDVQKDVQRFTMFVISSKQ